MNSNKGDVALIITSHINKPHMKLKKRENITRREPQDPGDENQPVLPIAILPVLGYLEEVTHCMFERALQLVHQVTPTSNRSQIIRVRYARGRRNCVALLDLGYSDLDVAKQV